MDLRLAGVSEPLHLTDRHRLFSATRQDWIPASELRVGEDLATRSGTTRIQSVSAAPGTHRVFNIEAESEHRFFAGKATLTEIKRKRRGRSRAFFVELL